MEIPTKKEFRAKYYKHYLKHEFNVTHTISKLDKERKKHKQFWYYNIIKRGLATGDCLDLGCGLGYLMYALEEYGFSVYGVDLSRKRIQACKDFGFKVTEDDLMPFLEKNKSKQWDTIILSDVLEHFTKEEAYAILKLIREHLTDKGRLILKIPNGGSIFTAQYSLAFNPTHETIFSETSIKAIGSMAGFSEVNVFPAHLFVFYRNPLNYGGMLFEILNSAFHKIIFMANGMFEKSVYTKNMIVSMYK